MSSESQTLAPSFFFWNIDQAGREEEHEETKWDVRSADVHKKIVESNADIVGLVELRDLDTSQENAASFIGSLSQYDSVQRRYCHYAQSFTMALLFNPEKYFVGDVRIVNFDHVPTNDKMAMFVDLQCKKTLRWFTVGLTHMALQEDRKWRSVHILKNMILAQKYPCLVYGDYNFFDDRDGILMRNEMLTRCTDLAHPLLDKNGVELSGTFAGFPHDTFKQQKENMSRLDHIFTSSDGRIKRVGDCVSPGLQLADLNNDSYETYKYASDHLALALKIEIC